MTKPRRYRDESPKTYSEKWGYDCCSFSWYCEIFTELQAEAGEHDEYLLIDSY